MTIHSSEKIVKNTVFLTTAMIGQKVFSFFYFWYLSSRFGPEKMGAWVWALSFSGLFGVLSDLGLATILAREAARHEDRSERLLNATVFIKIPLLIVSILLGAIILYFSGRSQEIVLLVVITFFVVVFDAFVVTFYAIPRAMQNLRYESIGVFIFQVIDVVFGVILWKATQSINWVIGSLALAGFFNFVYSFLIVKRYFKINPRVIYDKESIAHMLRILPAFAIAGIVNKVYNSADSVLLGYLGKEVNVGLYSVPAKVMTALQSLIPGVFVATIYPSMSNFYYHARERLNTLFEKSFTYMFLISLPMSIGLAFLAHQILGHIWPQYEAATLSFILMALALPFMFCAYPTGNLLNATDRQKITTTNRIIVTAIDLVINITLIPTLGVLAAAIAFLITNALALILDLLFTHKIVQFQVKKLLWQWSKISIATMIMGAVILLTREHLYYVFVVLLAALCYGFFIFIFRVVGREDFEFIAHLLKSRKVPLIEDAEKIKD